MNTKKCEACNTDFEGRENQKYCSDACKQQAYKNRKSGTDDEPMEQTKILGTFKKSEFKTSTIPDFLTFCFFRKNYKIEFVANEFDEYIDGFNDSNAVQNVGNLSSVEGKEFNKFKHQFFQGLYEVVD